ncbi:MAG: hypothetical protein Q7U37_08260 [Gallionella sp.]|nr:hypothetical protein [Gallionella sp.]MDP1942153.1 hypothetical protein [Gallionella sp.]
MIEEIYPVEIIAECLSLVSPLIAQKNIVVENLVKAGVALVRADYMRLKHVLINLL